MLIMRFSMDKNEFFAHPVDPEIVPDYYVHVKQPMDFSTMTERLNNHEYRALDEFEVIYLFEHNHNRLV